MRASLAERTRPALPRAGVVRATTSVMPGGACVVGSTTTMIKPAAPTRKGVQPAARDQFGHSFKKGLRHPPFVVATVERARLPHATKAFGFDVHEAILQCCARVTIVSGTVSRHCADLVQLARVDQEVHGFVEQRPLRREDMGAAAVAQRRVRDPVRRLQVPASTEEPLKRPRRKRETFNRKRRGAGKGRRPSD